MATSPNFNWPEPDNTDLVKNGALAIRTAVDAIDTSLVDLKGGTTGQVLAKASNTDMDFVWSADAAGISPTIFAAKGDLLGASANDTPAILSVGNNGETLVADSSTSTGLRYTAGNVIPNPIINSAFQVWQRGTSFTNGNSLTAYGADRWQIYSSNTTGRTWSRQSTNDTTNLPNIQYCQRLARNSGDTQTGIIYTIYNFETLNSIPFAGKTVTISYYARAGANYSSASNVLNVGFLTGTGTDQNSLAGYTGTTNSPFSATLTTTWQRFTHTVAVGATATEIGIQIGYTPVGTAGANDWFELTGAQMDIGSVALPFRTNGATIQGELAACQRYYERAISGNAYEVFAQGWATSSTNLRATYYYRVPKRVAATSIDFSTLRTSANTTVSNVTADALGIYSATVNATASSMTTNTFYTLLADNSTNAFLGFSAEL